MSDPIALGDAIAEVWESTAAVLNSRHVDWDHATGCPGWTVRDQVSHMIWSIRMWEGDPEPSCEVPDGLSHVRDDMGRYMEQAVHARRARSGDDVLAELNERGPRAAAKVRHLDAGAWQEEMVGPMGMAMPRARFISIQVFDQWAHEQDIRRALGEHATLHTPAARHSFRRIALGLASVLPDRVPAVAGTTIYFDLLNGGANGISLDLEAKTGTVLRKAPGHADLFIGLPADFFAALACGRAVAPAQVLFNGDAHLGEQVLSHLALTP